MHRSICEGSTGNGGGGKMSPLPSTVELAPQSSEVASSSMVNSTIGVNLRVTGHCNQGGRNHMEDFFSVAYHQSENKKDLEYAFIGIYDGHGGSEAATYAKEHLMMEIINQKLFWSDCDQDVLKAIREGYIATHYAMWREQENWPKTATGLPSTAGTTATIAFVRREKIYIGHVGDSGIVLGYQEPGEDFWRAKQLTQDHKPESITEKTRIANAGGKVMVKSGVPRVVWNRPRNGHKGPVRRSTPIEEIPFLAVARSLGDLWSYNSSLNEFIVSPDPDVKVIKINPETFRCLVFGTDGLWNVVSACDAVDVVRENEAMNEQYSRVRGGTASWINPSKYLVEKALKTWNSKKMRADNTSVVTVILYPTGSDGTMVSQRTHSYSVDNYHMKPETPVNEPFIEVPYDLDCELYNNCKRYQQGSYYDSSMHLHLQPHHQELYTPDCHGVDLDPYEPDIENNYEINGFLDYGDQGNNTYMNSFAESYNNLLTSSLMREESEFNSRSNSRNHDSSPTDFHCYNSLHSTGLAGYDRVQHHYPADEYELEQRQYQEHCMSAEEGYSLTKLETRGEQQLRTIESEQLTLSQAFQMLDCDSDDSEDLFQQDEVIYNQYNNVSSSYDNYFPTEDAEFELFGCYMRPDKELASSTGRTSFQNIDRLPNAEVDTLMSDGIELESTRKTPEEELEAHQAEKENCDKNLDETIQIHQISSSVTEARSSLDHPESEDNIQKSLTENTPPLKKCKDVVENSSMPKLIVYSSMSKENRRTTRRSSTVHRSNHFERRVLRSMTTDDSKRVLRSRSSLPNKEVKLKNNGSVSLRRSVPPSQNKLLKAIKNQTNLENTPVISRKVINLRSRQVTSTTNSIWPPKSTQIISSTFPLSTSTPANNQKHRKSKSDVINENMDFLNKRKMGNRISFSELQVTPNKVTRRSSANSLFHHRHQQIVSSTRKPNSRSNK